MDSCTPSNGLPASLERAVPQKKAAPTAVGGCYQNAPKLPTCFIQVFVTTQVAAVVVALCDVTAVMAAAAVVVFCEVDAMGMKP